jgi:hypothetical protein
MAAPHVTGLIALLMQVKADLTLTEARDALAASARELEGGSPASPNNEVGSGLVDAAAAVAAVRALTGGGGGGGGGNVVDATPTIVAGDLAEVLNGPLGQRWGAMSSVHFSEVHGLVNTNPRVGAFWRLMAGPELVRGVTHLGATGDARRLVALDWVEIKRRAPQFLEKLKKYGSPRLSADVERFGSTMLAETVTFVDRWLAQLIAAFAPNPDPAELAPGS